MKFEEALKAMKCGSKVKLPSWGGYWCWNPEKEAIIMHTKDGQELDIRETQNVEYTLQNILSDEWTLADKTNCPQLGGEATFSFGEAIKYLKRGMKVARKGWNGKKQYIQLATGISYKRDYRLKLKASTIGKLENKYRQNILNMLDDIPPLSVMLTIIQAAMEPWEHGMSYTKVQNLYDYWADKEGGNQTDLYSKVIIPTLAVSGFFTQEQADVLVEEMQNV